MGAVIAEEIVPGLVVHIDTGQLRTLGGSSTNAESKAGVDRAVQGPHYFLIVAVDDSSGTCTAVPLFSKQTPGSEMLEDSLKAGLSNKWIGEKSYFSKWQHWRIPINAVVAASSTDEASPGNRRMYAAANTAELTVIAKWARKNRAPWRDIAQ